MSDPIDPPGTHCVCGHTRGVHELGLPLAPCAEQCDCESFVVAQRWRSWFSPDGEYLGNRGGPLSTDEAEPKGAPFDEQLGGAKP